MHTSEDTKPSNEPVPINVLTVTQTREHFLSVF